MDKKNRFTLLYKIMALLLAGSLLASACAPAVLSEPTALPTVIIPTATALPAATETPLPATETPAAASPTTAPRLSYSLDSSGMAASLQEEQLAAAPASGDTPYWEVWPAYTRLTLKDYPVAKHVMQAQIFLYPVQDLTATNPAAGKVVASLKSLIDSPREIPDMPLLPLFNLKAVMHTHIQYLDFKSGQGLRYLTQLGQGVQPINNRNLIYVYQGLSRDGKTYVAAVLPLNHPSLPADELITGKEPAEFTSDFRGYVANIASTLNVQSSETFTPDLTRLDAMMSSLEIH